jgi:hypothetical protein
MLQIEMASENSNINRLRAALSDDGIGRIRWQTGSAYHSIPIHTGTSALTFARLAWVTVSIIRQIGTMA